MGEVITFPINPAQQPRPDTSFIGRPSRVLIEPDGTGWSVTLMDTDGCANLGEGLSKRAAVVMALAQVSRWNSEMEISNRSGGGAA